jgi:dTDP-4-dehydrorhamnose reductase
VRDAAARDLLPVSLRHCIVPNVDAGHLDSLLRVFAEFRPDVVINCIGVVKQLTSLQTALGLLPINALFPHRLAEICAISNTRLIHFSTDCVFSGTKGMYTEIDSPDALDLYGQSKRMGEVSGAGVLTIRTSIIGHELRSQFGLVEWFLNQTEEVQGFTNAVFSGLPTIEVARVLTEYVLPNPKLEGTYHLAAEPISKCALLKLIREIYNHNIPISETDEPVIDRSLDPCRFNAATGYRAKPWRQMISSMHEYR